MVARKLFLVLSLFFVFLATHHLKSQVSGFAIVLNEYNVSNVAGTGQADDKGVFSDYVEIYNNFSSKLSLAGYYLSNDPNNLFKWKFPSNFLLEVGEYQVVWLSGRDYNDGVNFHTNFVIEQCKNQSIILTSPNGVIYDQVKVVPTKAGHVRGRNTDYTTTGPNAWQIYPTKSPKAFNGLPIGRDYAPKPQFVTTAAQTATNLASATNTANAGGFYSEPPLVYMKLEGLTYDTAYVKCYDIFYTKNGDYPVPFYNGSNVNGNYYRYTDSLGTLITLDKTTMLRAIAVPRSSTICPNDVLPSFCETNTYFYSDEHNNFDKDFGILSIALEKTQSLDTAWFNNIGAASGPSIHVEYYDNKLQVSEGYAMLQKPVNESWRTKQKGFYIAKDDRLGYGCNFEGPIFNVDGLGTTPRKVFPQLHLSGGDFESHSAAIGSTQNESNGTGIRDVLMQSLAAKYNLNVNPLHIKPAILFVNGDYWGVYNLKEIYDKWYEEYYHGQSVDQLDLNFVHGAPNSVVGVEGKVSYWDIPGTGPGANFGTEVYQVVNNNSMSSSLAGSKYNQVMTAMDKANYIDYMILNNYSMNSDLWSHNIALAKGANKSLPGGNWHFYLWNMPSIFSFTAVSNNGLSFSDFSQPVCFLQNRNFQLTPNSLNGAGAILRKLFTPVVGNSAFQLEYRNRFQDLLNGPLKCDNILKHFDYIYKLYAKEMKYHESDASTPQKGKFTTTTLDRWDTLMIGDRNGLRKILAQRCYFAQTEFDKCYSGTGPYDVVVDVTPQGTGQVRVNTIFPDVYPWYGKYYSTQMYLKAIPTSTDYAFHHWEISGVNINAGMTATQDSIVVNLNQGASILAVFTDKKTGISNSGDNVNVPTGFTPNADGLNDFFRPLGAAEFMTEYQITIWNRWGQEVFRSTEVTNGWDGRYKGQEAQTGVYAYLITYRDIYNKEQIVKGNVTLTR